MKLLDFSNTDDSLISISSISAMGFGLPNLVAPKQAKDLNWESGVNADDSVVRFMGHGITSCAVGISALHGLDDDDKKTALKGLAVMHATVAGMVGHATYTKDLKQPIGVANVVVHSALAVAFAARGFRGESSSDE